MKRTLLFLAAIVATLTVEAKTLIVYYSYTNNVHRIVTELQQQITADVVRIQPAEKGLDYAANNYAIGSQQIAAIRENPTDEASYPAIDDVNVNLADYDKIVIGAPLWWSNMAAPLQTFLFKHSSEMADKDIALIVSSASSGISGVEGDAKRLVPQGNFLSPSLWIRSSQTTNSASLIADWLKKVDLRSTSDIASTATTDSPSVSVDGGMLHVDGAFDTFQVFNVRGLQLLSTRDSSIDISSWLRGAYIVQVQKGKDAVQMKICL